MTLDLLEKINKYKHKNQGKIVICDFSGYNW